MNNLSAAGNHAPHSGGAGESLWVGFPSFSAGACVHHDWQLFARSRHAQRHGGVVPHRDVSARPHARDAATRDGHAVDAETASGDAVRRGQP